MASLLRSKGIPMQSAILPALNPLRQRTACRVAPRQHSTRSNVTRTLATTSAQMGGSGEGDANAGPLAKPFEAEAEDRRKERLAQNDPNRQYEEMMRRREELRQVTMQQYGEVKREVSKIALGVGAAGTLYCFLGISIQSAISYTIGSAASCLYLLLLFNYIDTITPEDLPHSFRIDRKKPKRKGLVDALASVDSPQKVFDGARLALSSQRLLVPAALILLYAYNQNTWDGTSGSLHLEFGPLFLGFLSYKVAFLIYGLQEVTEN